MSNRSIPSASLRLEMCLIYRNMLTLLLLTLTAAQGADLEALKTRFGAEKDKAAAQRLDTVTALGALRTDDAGTFLLEVFEQDKDSAVRAAALKGLGEWGAPPALHKLVAVAGNPKEQFSLRATALESLTRPPTKEGFPIARAVTKESGEIRIFAWSGLRHYPLKETETLWRDALNDHDPLIRSMAMMALAPLKEVRLQDVARAALVSADGEPLIKYASVTVLQV